jgi:hypothetical protein
MHEANLTSVAAKDAVGLGLETNEVIVIDVRDDGIAEIPGISVAGAATDNVHMSYGPKTLFLTVCSSAKDISELEGCR